jgi:hypothetical protein
MMLLSFSLAFSFQHFVTLTPKLFLKKRKMNSRIVLRQLTKLTPLRAIPQMNRLTQRNIMTKSQGIWTHRLNAQRMSSLLGHQQGK